MYGAKFPELARFAPNDIDRLPQSPELESGLRRKSKIYLDLQSTNLQSTNLFELVTRALLEATSIARRKRKGKNKNTDRKGKIVIKKKINLAHEAYELLEVKVPNHVLDV